MGILFYSSGSCILFSWDDFIEIKTEWLYVYLTWAVQVWWRVTASNYSSGRHIDLTNLRWLHPRFWHQAADGKWGFNCYLTVLFKNKRLQQQLNSDLHPEATERSSNNHVCEELHQQREHAVNRVCTDGNSHSKNTVSHREHLMYPSDDENTSTCQLWPMWCHRFTFILQQHSLSRPSMLFQKDFIRFRKAELGYSTKTCCKYHCWPSNCRVLPRGPASAIGARTKSN